MAGLYIHIPFCIKKCLYCDLLSYPGRGEDEMRAYVLALAYSCAEKRALPVETVYIGGGTPSILPDGEVLRLLDAARRGYALTHDAEVTIEVNPATLTAAKVAEYRRAGVNRVSIGMQSADAGLLRALGRVHTYEDFLRTYELSRGVTDNVSVDVMYGLPGQGAAQHERTLQAVTVLGPAHVSAYGLILEEGTPFYEKHLPMDEDRLYELGSITRGVLAANGYERYEISNYARPGRQCRHNLNYWALGEYYALGEGAVSMLREGGTLTREKDGEKELISREDEIFEFVMMGTRLVNGFALEDFRARFGADFAAVYPAQARELKRLGLMEISGGSARLTERGLDIQNTALLHFL